jgi:hypothetical protein
VITIAIAIILQASQDIKGFTSLSSCILHLQTSATINIVPKRHQIS